MLPFVLSLCFAALDAPFDAIESPAAKGSQSPNLTVSAGGELLLSWLEIDQAGGVRTVRFATRVNGGAWSKPLAVASGAKISKDGSVPPTVVRLGDGSLIAEWTEVLLSSKTAYSEHVFISTSRDNGKTWSPRKQLNRDSVAAEHSYVSMAASGPREATAIWLDGRNGETYSLLAATIDGNGAVGPEQILDNDVCTCCPTALIASGSGGLLAAYRDHTGETRDISFVRWSGKEWSKPAPVAVDVWKINACPVNGPSLSSAGGKVASAWYTGAGGAPKVQVAFGEAKFASPIRVDLGNPSGRPSILLRPGGDAIVAWIEKEGAAAKLLVRTVSPQGKTGPVSVLAQGGQRSLGSARLVSAEGGAVAAWTDPASGTVRVARIR
jgi:hypothetical protein